MALSMKMQSARVVAGRRMQSAVAPRAMFAAPRMGAFSAQVATTSVRVSLRASRASRVVVEAAAKKSVGDLTKADLEGKRVLVRADLNVPLDKELKITDDTRIRAAIPTLKYLMDNGAKVLLTSHLVSMPLPCTCPCAELKSIGHIICRDVPRAKTALPTRRSSPWRPSWAA